MIKSSSIQIGFNKGSMFISRVELENIKSYEVADYQFDRGVTAISGPNGVGKTTIIEAIAYALFDSISYNKDDFLRRGAKKGIVRITFVSSIDGREYTVYRDTASGYYVYDPITKIRVVEQKSQVVKWIGEHLGVEAGVKLDTLFNTTIGVPQGTFTVNFAESPGKRKDEFDKVLRVEEYQQASEKMRPVTKVLEGITIELREEIARLEGEITKLDELLTEQVNHENTRRQLQNEINTTKAELSQTRAEVERLETIKKQLDALRAEATSLIIHLQEWQKKSIRIGEDVEQSRQANEIVSKTQAGFALYTESTAQILELEPQIQQRDDLRQKLQVQEREKIRVETLQQSKLEASEHLATEKKEAGRIKPLVEEQLILEKRQLELQKQLTELSILEVRARQDEQELKNLRNEYQEVKQKLQEIETLKDVSASLEELELQRSQVEVALRQAQVSLERLLLKKNEQKRAKENLAKIKGEITILEAELLEIHQIQKQANALVELEAKEAELTQRVTELRIRIDREQQFVSEIQNGLCPLLSQRCLNMKEGQLLDTHFKIKIDEEETWLHSLQVQQQENKKSLAVSKNASRKLSGLEEKRINLERHKQEYELEQRNITTLQKEIDKLIDSEQQLRQLSAQQANLQTALQQAQVARGKYEGLEPLRTRLQQLTVEGQQRREAWAALQTKLAEKPIIEEELNEIDSRLHHLADPKTRLSSIERELRKESRLRDELLSLSEQSKTIQSDIESLTEHLNAFSELDQILMRLRAQRTLSINDYQLYIENQPLAGMLQARETEQVETQVRMEQLESKHLEISEAISELSINYDTEQHLNTNYKLEELIGKNAALASELSIAEKRAEELQKAIEQLLEIRKTMLDLMKQKEREAQVCETTDFMRELLKKAGPYITEAHLQTISIEANQLYRDITGNPMVSLRWDTGYEIIVEEDGHEKAFLNLSGGEKMSAALSVRLALLKELSDIRIAFFDEPTANMDEERRRNLAQQIGAIKDFEQLFVVSHDDTFEGFTDKVVTIRKES